jgi:outer membrane protein assembly factor BamB
MSVAVRVVSAFVALIAAAALTGASTAAEFDWPAWRGPAGSGHTAETGVPTQWDASAVAWKSVLPGRGQSSPVIWGDRIFLTSYLEEGRKRLVFCVDRRNGSVLWQDVCWTGQPEPTHKMNGWASATCVTDGAHVWASFGKAGLHCYTVQGKRVWSRDLGVFLSKNKRGTAASPLVVGDIVIQNGDSESDPWLFGLNKLTGEIAWKTERPAAEGYSSPILFQVDGRTEVVLNGDKFVGGYEPATGKLLWRCKSFNGRGEPTPAPGKDAVYVVNGLAGDVYAVRPGGSGDVTAGRMIWHTPRKGGRDQPSPILVGEHLLVSNMQGILTCYSAKDGKELWKDRMGNGNFTASPISAGGRAYFLSEAGETIVIEPGPALKVAARSATPGAAGDELFRASAAVSRGQVFIRSDRVLYCIGKAK